MATQVDRYSASAKIIDGTAIAKLLCVHIVFSTLILTTPHQFRSIRTEIAQRINTLKSTYPRFQPQLIIVQAGSRPDSTVYVRMKIKAAEEVGILYKHITLPVEATVDEIVDVVQKLNSDDAVSGIIVQLPLGDHIGPDGERTVTEAISPEKDVDGYASSCLHPNSHSRHVW